MEAKDCNTVVSNRGQWPWAEGLNEDVSKQVNSRQRIMALQAGKGQ